MAVLSARDLESDAVGPASPSMSAWCRHRRRHRDAAGSAASSRCGRPGIVIATLSALRRDVGPAASSRLCQSSVLMAMLSARRPGIDVVGSALSSRRWRLGCSASSSRDSRRCRLGIVIATLSGRLPGVVIATTRSA
jgi:hypothetical protein